MSRKSKLRFTDTFQMTHQSKKPKMTKSCYDYEKFQPCFMSDDSEEFYSLNTPTPSEDIWKKFELLPTPPRSPKREPFDFNLDYDIGDISNYLNDDIFVNPIAGDLPFPESPSNPLGIHSKLIQDCMWSGSQKGSDLAESKPTEVNLDVTTSSDCVDPTAVFPYPINDTKVHSLGTETPSDSEEEEVDVVSTGDEKFTTQAVQVDHQINTAMKNNKTCVQRTPVKCTNVKIEPKPVVSNSDCAAISVHNYSLPYSHGVKRSRSTHTQHVVSHKRTKREQTEPVLKSVALKLKSTHHDLISDSEESCEGKRTQHNVLERKRRNDLKDSFFVLRDNVPELDSKEKAPKVLILRKASEYILSLRRQDVKYVKELNALQQRNEMLRKRLEELEAETDSDEEYSI